MTWISYAIIGGVIYAAAVAGVLKFLRGATGGVMIRWCGTCKAETEFDEGFEDRFNPGSAYGHYQVATGLYCLECGNEWDPEEEGP